MAYKLELDEPGLFRTQGFINGQWVDARSRTTFPCIDPGTGNTFSSCAEMSPVDTLDAIAAATAASPAFAREAPRERARKLLRFDELLRLHKEDLARVVVFETGKPFSEALAEVDYASTFSWWMVGEAERSVGQSIPSATTGTMRYVTIQQPIGPVALMCPWNFPVALAVRKAATALAAGCPFILKPSPESPFSALILAHLFEQAGFAAGTVNVVTASHETTPEVGKTLCEHPDIKKVSFTGRLIMEQCSPTLKKLTLELGGNGAFVVFDDADIDLAVEGLMASKWRHAGQACVTANRIFLQRTILDRFVSRFADRMSSLVVGHGMSPPTTLGALTTPQSLDRAERHVKDAVARGAKVVVGGKRVVDRGGFFFEPTLLIDVDPDSEIAKEETFTPIAAVQTFDDEEEVVRRVNATEMGLTNYVYTKDLARAWRCVEAFQSGSVGVNAPNVTTAEAPFGGILQSGMGKEAGVGFGIREFQITKTGAFNIS